ncbi:MAG: hypothetical protein QMB25_04900 [Pseudomonadales bacterium]
MTDAEGLVFYPSTIGDGHPRKLAGEWVLPDKDPIAVAGYVAVM